MLACVEGQILHTLGTTWRKLIENIEKSTETNQIRTRTSELTRKVLSRRISMLGNFRNVSPDLLNQHAETVHIDERALSVAECAPRIWPSRLAG